MNHVRTLTMIALASGIASCASVPHGASDDGQIRFGVLRGPLYDVSYVEWPGAGIPIVLLHGLGGNALWWGGLAKALPRRHIIALDLPGHGQSPSVADWRVSSLASTVVAAVDKRWRGPRVWGGHSWGGKLAVAAAALDKNTRGLILADSSPIAAGVISELFRSDMGALAEQLLDAELKTYRSVAEAMQAVQQLPQYQTWTPELHAAFRRGITTQGGRVTAVVTRERAAEILNSVDTSDLTVQAQRLTVPILSVSSEENRQMGVGVATALPHPTEVVVPGNHWVNVNAIKPFAAALAQWLKTNGLE